MSARPGPAFSDDEAGQFVTHYDSLRGRVRTENVHRQLLDHVLGAALRVVDIGGGAGTQSVPLAALGHRVTIVDPSPAMLDRARTALSAGPSDLRDRVTLVEASGEDAPLVLGKDRFDIVLCHGVLMYLEDPAAMLDALVALVTAGGVVSILATNKHGIADRAARRGRWREALGLFDADRYVNGLGITARADTPDAIAAALTARGLTPEAWYGVRVFSDAWLADRPVDEVGDVLAVEWEACRRDPYRQLSRLFHLVARRPAG
jgi:SAM-dependent methyltransferase